MLLQDNRIKSSKSLVKQRVRELQNRTSYLYEKMRKVKNTDLIFAMIKENQQRIANLLKK